MNWWDDNMTPWISTPQVAGVLGSIISLRWAPGRRWVDRAFSVACGLGVAFYGAPWLAQHLEVSSNAGLALFGFLGGLLGMNLIIKGRGIMDKLDWKAILLPLVSGKKTGKDD